MDWQRSLAGIELWLLLLCLPMPFTLIQAWSLPAHPVAPPAAAPVPAAIPVARAATTTPAGRQLNGKLCQVTWLQNLNQKHFCFSTNDSAQPKFFNFFLNFYFFFFIFTIFGFSDM